MTVFVTSLRRLLWMVLIAAAGGAAYAFWRDRRDDDPLAPAEWPPLEPQSDIAPPVAAGTDAADSTANSSTAGSSIAGSSSGSTTSPTASGAAPAAGTVTTRPTGTGTASFVNSLVDAPEARSTDGIAGGWVPPLDDGSCPVSHPIKANDNSGIFHVPDGRFYERTKAERCYADPEAATADGYRQAKN